MPLAGFRSHQMAPKVETDISALANLSQPQVREWLARTMVTSTWQSSTRDQLMQELTNLMSTPAYYITWFWHCRTAWFRNESLLKAHEYLNKPQGSTLLFQALQSDDLVRSWGMQPRTLVLVHVGTCFRHDFMYRKLRGFRAMQDACLHVFEVAAYCPRFWLVVIGLETSYFKY